MGAWERTGKHAVRRSLGPLLTGRAWLDSAGWRWALSVLDRVACVQAGTADTQEAAQAACDAAAARLLREALADLGGDEPCRGIEIEPGVFSGCDPSRAPPTGNDCPACAERAKGVR